MGKMLIVAEKPSVARDLAAALGGFAMVNGVLESATAVISNARGHLVSSTVPEAATTGYDLTTLPVIPKAFSLEIRNSDGCGEQFRLLKKLMARSDVDMVVNACDAAREGELIFRLIYEHAGCQKPTKRLWIQSMTREALVEAFGAMRPGSDYDNLGDAAKCRSEADWLVGINGTRGISQLKSFEAGTRVTMRAGRVQTPTLAILVHLEDRIRSFVPKDYFEVHAMFRAAAGVYKAKWTGKGGAAAQAADGVSDEGRETDQQSQGRFDKRASAEAIFSMCDGIDPTSVIDTVKPSSMAAPDLFSLTSLQQEANKRFRLSAKDTLDLAQALYETHKATTYPRTDYSALPEDYVEKVREVLETFSGTAYAQHAQRVLSSGWVKPTKSIFNNAKVGDHFAIIPTGVRPSGMTEDEAKIYDLIVKRFLAVFHPPAQYSTTTRTTVVAGETFVCSGKVLVKPGWKEVYSRDEPEQESGTLCAVIPGEPVRNEEVKVEAKKTTPPSRMTEATLLAAMETAGKLIDDKDLRAAMSEKGLGTPATRAATIEGLVAKKGPKGPVDPYITREGKAQHLVPTDKGLDLVHFLDQNGLTALTSPQMTGEWEHRLGQMERGAYRRDVFMAEIAEMTRQMIDVIRKKAGSRVVATTTLDVTCPQCKKGQMQSAQSSFDCAARCGLRVFRDIAKRRLSDDEALVLLREGQTGQLDGFISAKSGKPFSAALKLVGGKVEFAFEDRRTGGSGTGGGGGGAGSFGPPTGPKLTAKCPKCRGAVHDQGPLFVCEKGDFKLWKNIAKRDLLTTEAEVLIAKGRVGPLVGFESGAGRKFTAIVKLDPSGKTELEFERR